MVLFETLVTLVVAVFRARKVNNQTVSDLLALSVGIPESVFFRLAVELAGLSYKIL